MERVLEADVGALAAEKEPAGENGVCDQPGVFVGGGLIILKVAFEEGEELVGIFAEDEDFDGCAAVREAVEAGTGFGAEFGRN